MIESIIFFILLCLLFFGVLFAFYSKMDEYTDPLLDFMLLIFLIITGSLILSIFSIEIAQFLLAPIKP